MDTSPSKKNVAILTIAYRPGADILTIWVKGEIVNNAAEDDFSFHELMEDFRINTLNLNGVEVFCGSSVIGTSKVTGWKTLLSAYLPDDVIYMAEKVMEASAIVPRNLPGDGPIVYGGGITMELFVDLDLLACQFA